MSEGENGSGQGPNLFAQFFDFEKLIGATLIKIVYYLGLVGIVLWCLVALAGLLTIGRYADSSTVMVGFLTAVVGLVVWIVFWRFICELWMVIFKIHDRLGEIRDRLPPKA